MIKNIIKNEIVNYSHSESIKGETNFRIHCHESYEILFVIRGGIHYIIEGESYFPVNCSFLLIPPGVVHGIEANNSDRYERYVAHINFANAKQSTKELILKVFSKGKYYVPQNSATLRDVFEQIFLATNIDQALFTPSFEAMLLKLLMVVLNNPSERPVVQARKNFSDIIEYINENYKSIESLDELTAKFYISKHHLNETFKKLTGVTVWEYIIRKRIYFASTLIHSGVSAIESAEQSGFTDYSAFYKAYKKRTGKSPKQ